MIISKFNREKESERKRESQTDRQTDGQREREKCNTVVLYIQPHLTTTKSS